MSTAYAIKTVHINSYLPSEESITATQIVTLDTGADIEFKIHSGKVDMCMSFSDNNYKVVVTMLLYSKIKLEWTVRGENTEVCISDRGWRLTFPCRGDAVVDSPVPDVLLDLALDKATKASQRLQISKKNLIA